MGLQTKLACALPPDSTSEAEPACVLLTRRGFEPRNLAVYRTLVLKLLVASNVANDHRVTYYRTLRSLLSVKTPPPYSEYKVRSAVTVCGVFSAFSGIEQGLRSR